MKATPSYISYDDGPGGGFGASSDTKNLDQIAKAQDSCLAKFYDQVGTVWSVAQIPTDPEVRRRDMVAFRACLEKAGVDVPADLTPESLSAALGEDEFNKKVAQQSDQGVEPELELPPLMAAAKPCRDQYGYLMQ